MQIPGPYNFKKPWLGPWNLNFHNPGDSDADGSWAMVWQTQPFAKLWSHLSFSAGLGGGLNHVLEMLPWSQSTA